MQVRRCGLLQVLGELQTDRFLRHAFEITTAFAPLRSPSIEKRQQGGYIFYSTQI